MGAIESIQTILTLKIYTLERRETTTVIYFTEKLKKNIRQRRENSEEKLE